MRPVNFAATARREPRTVSVSAVTAIAVAAGLGASVATGPTVVFICGAAAALAVSAWLAVAFPHVGFAVAVTSTTLIPFVGFPSAYGFVLHPAVVYLTLLAVLTATKVVPAGRAGIRFLDWLVLLFVVGHVASVAVGVQPVGFTIYSLCLVVGPYFGGRAFTSRWGVRPVLVALATAGAAAAPFVIVELLAGNPFVKVFPFLDQGLLADGRSALGGEVTRLGATRAQGALAQPIPFAMVMATSALSALVLWLTRTRRSDHRWLVVSAVCALSQAAALSRNGWLVLAVGGACVAALMGRRLITSRNTALVVAGALTFVGTMTYGPARSLLFGGGSSADIAQLQASADYRSQLVDEALSPGVLKPFGDTGVFRTSSGTGSIDNGYVAIGFRFGLLPLGALIGMFFALLVGAWRERARPAEVLAIYAIQIATLVALWSVAFIGIQGGIFWLLLGAISGSVSPTRHAATTDPVPLPVMR